VGHRIERGHRPQQQLWGSRQQQYVASLLVTLGGRGFGLEQLLSSHAGRRSLGNPHGPVQQSPLRWWQLGICRAATGQAAAAAVLECISIGLHKVSPRWPSGLGQQYCGILLSLHSNSVDARAGDWCV
jgi:hypothetical protein